MRFLLGFNVFLLAVQVLFRDFIEYHLSRGGLCHYDGDSLQESKEDISREYPLLKTRDNLNSDYLYNLFKKIAE